MGKPYFTPCFHESVAIFVLKLSFWQSKQKICFLFDVMLWRLVSFMPSLTFSFIYQKNNWFPSSCWSDRICVSE